MGQFFQGQRGALAIKALADHGVDGRYCPLHRGPQFLFLTKSPDRYLHVYQPGLFD